MSGTTPERGCSVGSGEDLTHSGTLAPSCSQGQAQSSCSRVGRIQGSALEVGRLSPGRAPCAGTAPHMGEDAHSGVSSMSKVSDSAGRHSQGYGARTWPQPGPPGAPPDSPNCPPALFSAPSLLLPNCMSESRVRGDMGRSMVLLKEVLSEGEKAQKPPESGPGQSSLTSPLPAEGPPGTAQRPPELSRGKGPQRGRTGLWFGQQPEPGSAPHHHPRLGTPQ